MRRWMMAVAVLLGYAQMAERTVESLVADTKRGACVVSNVTDESIVFMCTDGIFVMDKAGVVTRQARTP